MADNRIVLKHLPTGDEFGLVKFYYSSGWYVNVDTDEAKIKYVDRLNEWLHRRLCDDMHNRGANYAIEYEVGDPTQAERTDE